MGNSPHTDVIASRENNKFSGQCELKIRLSFSEKKITTELYGVNPSGNAF
jgi:hypothetical protein